MKINQQDITIAQKILTDNLGWQKGEKILIITDQNMKNLEAKVWKQAAQALHLEIKTLIIPDMTHSGQEPAKDIVEACKKFDISLFQTSYSLTHTQAGKAVAASGHRAFSLPGVNLSMMRRTFGADYSQINKLGKKIKQNLEKAKTIDITSPFGTEITAQIRTKKIFNDSGFLKNGQIGNLPAGEVFFAPILGSTNGKFIINASLADFPSEEIKKQAIEVTIENGKAVKFSGGKISQQLEKKLAQIGPNAFNIAEIGIGTNNSTDPYGSMIEAEKALGTAHIAFGNSSCMGGEVDVPIHLDALTLQAKIRVDDKIVPNK